jgi:hypothetical protein
LRVLNLANEVEELEAWKEGSLVTVRFRFGQVLETRSVSTGLFRYSFGGYFDPFGRVVWHSELESLEGEGAPQKPPSGREAEVQIWADRITRGMVSEYNVMVTLVSAGAKVDVRGRPDLVLVALLPPPEGAALGAAKGTLSVSSGEGFASARLTGVPGGMRVEVSSSGSGFSAVKLSVRREVAWWPTTTDGPSEIFYSETLASFEPGRNVVYEWRPEYPRYEPLVVAIPTHPSFGQVLELLRAMNVEARRTQMGTYIQLGKPFYVFADLNPVRTELVLTLSRRLRRDVNDATDVQLEGLK